MGWRVRFLSKTAVYQNRTDFLSRKVEIKPGELMELHNENGSGGRCVIVLGKNPLGPKGGRSGKWVDGRIICQAYGTPDWFLKFWRAMLVRFCHEGDDDQRAWGAERLLTFDSHDKTIHPKQATFML